MRQIHAVIPPKDKSHTVDSKTPQEQHSAPSEFMTVRMTVAGYKLRYEDARSYITRRVGLAGLVLGANSYYVKEYFYDPVPAAAHAQMFVDFLPSAMLIGIALAMWVDTWLYSTRRQSVEEGRRLGKLHGDETDAFGALVDWDYFLSGFRFDVFYYLFVLVWGPSVILQIPSLFA